MKVKEYGEKIGQKGKENKKGERKIQRKRKGKKEERGNGRRTERKKIGCLTITSLILYRFLPPPVRAKFGRQE